MPFFIPKSEFTHYGWFYFIPVYIHRGDWTIAGRNLIFDYLLLAAHWFHNSFTERCAQMLAAAFDWYYQPNLPVTITARIEHENIENKEESE